VTPNYPKYAARSALMGALACVAATSLSAAEGGGKNRAVTLDRVIAVVNSEVITLVDLNEQMKAAMLQLRRQGTPAPEREVLEAQLLERMVTTRILIQAAKEAGVRVDDAQVGLAVERMAKDNKLAPEEFRAAIENDGITFQRFREDLRNEILISRLRDREVDSKLFITDAEIDNYLANQKLQAAGEDEYNVGHILVLVPERASPEQIQARRAIAEKALEQLKSGTDFRQVSAGMSDAPNALEGGPLGWRTLSRLPQLFAEAVANLPPGATTGVLRSANGFHILKLLERRGQNAPVIVQQTRVRHILIRLNEVVSEADAKQRLADLRERIENGADFATLARLHSGDASASRGGELGWMSPGDTVPEFERAMNALKPGEIGAPFPSAFGWHLVQVLERRTEDMSKERQRLMARQAIRARRSDEAFQEWVRQQRDRAYVELKRIER
jgi:peptidyl-prolyl cis-trans isomerase SurA